MQLTPNSLIADEEIRSNQHLKNKIFDSPPPLYFGRYNKMFQTENSCNIIAFSSDILLMSRNWATRRENANFPTIRYSYAL